MLPRTLTFPPISDVSNPLRCFLIYLKRAKIECPFFQTIKVTSTICFLHINVLSCTAVAIIVRLNLRVCVRVCIGLHVCPHCLIVGYNKALEIQPPGVLPGCGGPHFFIKNCNPAAEALLHHNVTELYKGKHMRPGPNLQICPNR